MSVSRKIYSELVVTMAFFQKKILQFLYNKIHSRIASFKLRNYKDDIRGVERLGTPKSGSFAVFVYFEPDGNISSSVRRAFSALSRNDINIVLVNNMPLSTQQAAFFKANCHTILTRGNQGFDFGAYKDAIRYLNEEEIRPDRLILMNDSVFFAERGLDEMICRLLGEADVISAYENWGEDHHLQSFAISFSAYVLENEIFASFWRNYIPMNSRLHAIERGEKMLSRAALKSARSSGVIYSATQLFEAILNSNETETSIHVERVAQPFREELFNNKDVDFDAADRHSIHRLVRVLNSSSPIHSGAYLFPKFLNSPLFKKDLVYRGRFDFWEVASWTRKIMTPEEHFEYMSMLRKKSDYSSLNATEKRKYSIGMK